MNITLSIPSTDIKKYLLRQIYQTNNREIKIMIEVIIEREIMKQLAGKRFEAILKDCIYSNIKHFTVKELKKYGRVLK